MKLVIRIFLMISLWMGLPLVLHAYFHLTMPSPLSKPLMLLLLYLGFSWSIALLAFVMTTSRQQLFQRPLPQRTAQLLALYGLFAIMLAILTSPWLAGATIDVILQTASLGLFYCYLAGLCYWTLFLKAGRT